MLKIISTIVFIAFGVFGGYATYELGFGAYGIVGAVLVTAGLLWEIWIQPARDEAYRQQMLADIEGLRFEPIPSLRNIQAGQDAVDDLQERLNVVSDAYVTLKEDQHE